MVYKCNLPAKKFAKKGQGFRLGTLRMGVWHQSQQRLQLHIYGGNAVILKLINIGINCFILFIKLSMYFE